MSAPHHQPLGSVLPVSTGHPVVDAAVRVLAEAEQAPPAAQLSGYQAAHRTLRETLASIDEEG